MHVFLGSISLLTAVHVDNTCMYMYRCSISYVLLKSFVPVIDYSGLLNNISDRAFQLLNHVKILPRFSHDKS